MNTIRVNDDESSIRRLLAAILEGNGHRIVQAENGPEGLTLFQEERRLCLS